MADYANLDRYAMWDFEKENPNIIRATGQVESAEEEAAGRVGAAQWNYLASLNRRAAGGPVEKDQPVIVGEKGPEVIVPKTDGTVIPNRSLADLAPAGRGRETGKWQDLGGGLQAAADTGTYNRPEHREVVGAGGGPIQVIRGMRSTYAGGAPGEEYGSLQRAAQAVRRATGQEQWVPPEQEKEVLKHKNRMEEIAAGGKAQEVALGQGRVARQDALDYLDNMLLQQHGVEEKDAKGAPTGKKVLPGYAQELKLRYLPNIKSLEDVPGILKQIGPELESTKQMDLFNNPASRESSRSVVEQVYKQDMASAGKPVDPNILNLIRKGGVSPQNIGFFRQAYERGQTPAPQPPSVKAAAAAPSIRQQRKAAEREEYERSQIAPGHDFSTVNPENLQRAWQAKQTERERREQELDAAFARKLQGRAAGGPVEKDQPYVVGEKGLEVYVPDLSALAPARQTQYDEVALAKGDRERVDA